MTPNDIQAIAALVYRQMAADPGQWKGPKGDPGEPGEISATRLEEIRRRLELLEGAEFSVTFASGDEDEEAARTIKIKAAGGELVIPPQQLRIRPVDRHGNQVGAPVFDRAPLGMPLKVKNRPPE